MPLIKQYSRISHHTITTSGLTGSTIFTVPSTEDLSSGTWSVNDLALSEIGVAEGLGRVFIRVGNNIKEFNFGTGGTSTAQQFTGNTSATCITDLYVSNLYGCSPITVRDEMIHKEYAFYTPMSAYTTYGSTVPFLSGASGNVLVTKEYVDNLGVNIGEGNVIAVKCVQAIPLINTVYDNGIAGVGAILSATTNYSINTVYFENQIFVGDRVLVREQPNQIHNGVYIVLNLGGTTSKFILERTADSDETSELEAQIVIPSAGASAGRRFAQLTNDPIVGTNNISYADVGSLFVTQNPGGTQLTGQIAYWTATGRQLFKGSTNLYYNQTLNRMGIGTSNPQETLHVSGKTRTTNFQMTSGATAGYVLTAIDANGNAAWRPVSGGTGGGGTFTGNTSATCITDLYVNNIIECPGQGYINIVGNISAGEANQTVSGTSFAFGSSNNITGTFATAFGTSNTLIDENSIAVGVNNTTNGDRCVAFGSSMTLNSQHSVGIGRTITCDGEYGFGSGKDVTVKSFGEISRSSWGTAGQYGTVTYFGSATSTGTTLYLDENSTFPGLIVDDDYAYKINVYGVAKSANNEIAEYESKLIGLVTSGDITFINLNSGTFGTTINNSDPYLLNSKISLSTNGDNILAADFNLGTGFTSNISIALKLDYVRVL